MGDMNIVINKIIDTVKDETERNELIWAYLNIRIKKYRRLKDETSDEKLKSEYILEIIKTQEKIDELGRLS